MLVARHPALIAALQALALAGCGETEMKDPAKEAREAAAARAWTKQSQAACASPLTFDRLKQIAFDEAIRQGSADPENLDTLSSHATLRIENPIVKGHDEYLDVTQCSGRFILYLPPGAERGFSGDRRLEAQVEYSAQAAADGSGLVYSMSGAEPVIQRLAGFTLRGQPYRRAPIEAEPRLAERSEQAAPPEMPPPPEPKPAPSPRPEPARPEARPKAKEAPPPPSRPTSASSPSKRAAAAASPSFNCRHARTRSEKMVCASNRLAALDRSMSAMYYEALSDADGRTRSTLRRSRDRFLAVRERCADEDCVARVYRDRMDEIDDIASEN